MNEMNWLELILCRLINLEFLSVDGNQLTTLPGEICALSHMVEIHAANNQLTSLPMELGFLVKLKKFHVQQNRIKELPEGMGKLRNLEVIDVAANELRIFPTEVGMHEWNRSVHWKGPVTCCKEVDHKKSFECYTTFVSLMNHLPVCWTDSQWNLSLYCSKWRLIWL